MQTLGEIIHLNMKKQIKRLVLGLLGIIVIFLAIYMFIAQSEIKKMSPIDSSEIVEQVFALKDSFCNMYLIKEGEEYIAIDAGNDTENIHKELKKLDIPPQKVKAVLLTHSDGDHTAALSLFENAEVYLSTEEEQLVTGQSSRFFLFGNSMEAENYKLLRDQELLIIGNTSIKCFLVPGHTPGSMCYLVNDKYLFVGDGMGIKDNAFIPFNSFFNMDTEKAIKSMPIIQNIAEAEYIFTAHYGYMKNI